MGKKPTVSLLQNLICNNEKRSSLLRSTVILSAMAPSLLYGNVFAAERTDEKTGMSFITSASSEVKIQGIVKDETGEPLIGVSVVVEGTTIGTITDFDGNYELSVPAGSKLVFSYIGYEAQSFKTDGKTVINVVMREDSKNLEEVVVVGFGAQKKANLTGAVAQVKMADVLGDRPVVNAMSALQGTMPGLQISGGSGPGQSKSFNIRGTNSINGGSPLVLIDNVPGDIDMLNPEDIESVSVLKDAASSAIYGARAAFGVILVTTKKGKKGDKFTLNYNNNFGFQNSINRPQQAGAADVLSAYLDAGFNQGRYYTGQDVSKWIEYLNGYKKDPSQFNTYGDGVYVAEDGFNYYLNEKDIYGNMLEKHGFLQSHNVSATGGSDKINYRLSLGYNNEDGILYTDKDKYDRISVGSYVDAQITPWLSQSIDFRYARSNRNMPYETQGTLYQMRLLNLYPEGELQTSDGSFLPTNTPRNLLEHAGYNNAVVDNPRILSRTTLKPLKGLEVNFEYTFDKRVYASKQYNQPYDLTTIELIRKQSVNNSIFEKTKENTNYNALNLFGTYRYSLKEKHNFSAMAGFNQESSKFEKDYLKRLNMINENNPSFSGATGESFIQDTYKDYTVRGFFYRLNYDYEGKYLIETNGRYDGSSKFPKKSRFGFFPSFSLGWNMARENFMAKTNDWLDELKLRGSWGQIGNQAIDPYQFTPVMNPIKADWIYGVERPTSLDAPGLISSFFTWETVETLDLGFDMAVLNGRLRSTFDWYQRDTKDMLAPGIELPSVVGASAPLQNVADLRTKGWELSVSWRDAIGDIGYNIGFNLYDSKTEVTKYDNKSGILFKSDGSNQYYEGYQMGQIWGYVTDGFYTVNDFEDLTIWKLKPGVPSIQGVTVKPGDVKFKNLRDDEGSNNQIDGGDGTLANPGDRKIIGNNSNRYQYGITAGLNWKGFDLNILLQGTGKRDYWTNDDRRWAFNSGRFGTIFDDQLDYWKPIQTSDPSAPGYYEPVNPNSEYFRMYNERENAGSNTRTQTGYLLNASYLRLKNVTLSYSFQKNMLEKIHLAGLKVFVSGENLHTWTKLPKGYDPERMSWGYPFYRTISFGINLTL